jgi:hypothetical protein
LSDWDLPERRVRECEKNGAKEKKIKFMLSGGPFLFQKKFGKKSFQNCFLKKVLQKNYNCNFTICPTCNATS